MSNSTVITNKSVKPVIKSGENNPGFTLFQSVFLILLTVIVSVTGWYMVGKYYFWNQLDMKRVGQQVSVLEARVRKQPKNITLRIALGYSYFLNGDNDKAIQQYTEVLKVDKNYFDAYYNLGLVYIDDDNLTEAQKMFDKCIKISPKDYKGYLQKGIVLRNMEKYQQAISILQKADELSPRSSDIIYQIGMVAEAKGDKKIAIEIYNEALRYDPQYKDALEALKRLQ